MISNSARPMVELLESRSLLSTMTATNADPTASQNALIAAQLQQGVIMTLVSPPVAQGIGQPGTGLSNGAGDTGTNALGSVISNALSSSVVGSLLLANSPSFAGGNPAAGFRPESIPLNMLLTNALTGATFGDGVPNLLMQGSIRAADIPPVQIPGRLALSYEGTAAPQSPQPASDSSSDTLSANAPTELDQALAIDHIFMR